MYKNLESKIKDLNFNLDAMNARMNRMENDLLVMIANLQNGIVNFSGEINKLQNTFLDLETRIANQESIVTKILEVLSNVK